MLTQKHRSGHTHTHTHLELVHEEVLQDRHLGCLAAHANLVTPHTALGLLTLQHASRNTQDESSPSSPAAAAFGLLAARDCVNHQHHQEKDSNLILHDCWQPLSVDTNLIAEHSSILLCDVINLCHTGDDLGAIGGLPVLLLLCGDVVAGKQHRACCHAPHITALCRLGLVELEQRHAAGLLVSVMNYCLSRLFACCSGFDGLRASLQVLSDVLRNKEALRGDLSAVFHRIVTASCITF